MKLNIQKHVSVERSIRVRQLEALFEVPATEKLSVSIQGELPLEERPWHVGLIVGPSGSGKSLTLRELGLPRQLEWTHASVIDDFPKEIPMAEVIELCRSVGFNTIPAWMRPFSTLSNGEQFRVSIARLLAETAPRGRTLVDEFTSVVDRQVARVASHSVQKVVRSRGLQLVAASCHYDIIDWLQPDWTFEPAEARFQWRELRQGRPPIECQIQRVSYEAWKIFAPFHYMTRELNHAAQCFGLFVNSSLAAFAGNLHRPHPRVKDIIGCSRLVTLPDWQGLGLAMVLVDTLGAAYTTVGKRLHCYPNHPALVRSYAKSLNWKEEKAHGDFSPRAGDSSTAKMGGRSCAVYSYCGPPMTSFEEANKLLQGA